MPRVTMRDIAEVVGVSVMTVSNAFNRPDQLSPGLRQRILDRATKMGYSGPDAAARHLRSGRTNSYGVVFSEKLSYAFSDPFASVWLTAFTQVMEQHHASVLLLSVPASDAAAAVRDASIDGLAGLCQDVVATRQARDRGLPTVVCSFDEDREPPGGYVIIDDYEAGMDVAAHLKRLGHKRISLLVEDAQLAGGPAQVSETDLRALRGGARRAGRVERVQRISGLLDGLADVSLKLFVAGPNSRASGRRAAAEILDTSQRPTAVICTSDILALGFADACAERGLAVGADVSVVGFDDIPEAAQAGLTTIHQPVADKGRLAAELLLDPDREPRRIVLPHRLVVRSSTQPVPQPARPITD